MKDRPTQQDIPVQTAVARAARSGGRGSGRGSDGIVKDCLSLSQHLAGGGKGVGGRESGGGGVEGLDSRSTMLNNWRGRSWWLYCSSRRIGGRQRSGSERTRWRASRSSVAVGGRGGDGGGGVVLGCEARGLLPFLPGKVRAVAAPITFPTILL